MICFGFRASDFGYAIEVIHTQIPQAVVERVLLPLGVVSAEAMPPGMSGALVFRCRHQSGQLSALKRWPLGTRRRRIEEVHSVIERFRDDDFGLVPMVHTIWPNSTGRRATYFGHEGRYWEMSEWMPGWPAGIDATLGQIRAGAEAIARFHACSAGLGVRRQLPPAVISRLRRLDELAWQIDRAIQLSGRGQGDPRLTEAVQTASRIVQENWGEVRAKISRSLSQYADRNLPTQYVLRDIHRDHILYTDQQPTGMIDFDAIRVDTPATDLARWVGSFLAGPRDPKSVWQSALAGFCEGNPSMDSAEMEFDLRMAKDLCFATNWISLANWLVWLLCEQRSFPPGPKIVARRIRELAKATSL